MLLEEKRLQTQQRRIDAINLAQAQADKDQLEKLEAEYAHEKLRWHVLKSAAHERQQGGLRPTVA